MKIKFLSLNQWLNLFNLQKISFNKFYNNAIINDKYNTKLNQKKIDKNTVYKLYEIFIIKKIDYLINFYNMSLKIPDDLDLNHIDSIEISNSKNPKYKNIIRNMYYNEILYNTTTDIKSSRSYLRVLLDLFNNLIIDYKLVTPSGLRYIKNGNFGSIMSAFYFRASILNPAAIYSLSKLKLKGGKVFTPTLGWSSYMYGLLSDNRITEYVGTDVIPKVCDTTLKLSKLLFPTKIVDIYCSPSEDLLKNLKFKNKYKNYFDIIFFSPPYYKLELYEGKLQSTNRYTDYNTWLKKYWEATIRLCNYVLKKGGTLIYIVSGYDKYSNLNIDMNTITKKYFTLINYQPLNNKKMYNNNTEIIYFFR